MNGSDFFLRMCKEAQDQLAEGKKGWHDCDTNTLLLAAFGIFFNHVTHKLSRPLWFFAGAVATAVIGYFVKAFIFGG